MLRLFSRCQEGFWKWGWVTKQQLLTQIAQKGNPEDKLVNAEGTPGLISALWPAVSRCFPFDYESNGL